MLALFLGAAPFVVAQQPEAREILDGVRWQHSQQNASLTGQLRVGSERMPFELTLQDGTVKYAFPSSGETYILELEESHSRLLREQKGRRQELTGAALSTPIASSCVTPADLALSFLYWPNAKMLGDDVLRTRGAWKLQVHAPRTDEPYAVVRVWIDKQSGAILRMEGYDWDGKLVKRFEVISAQKIVDKWTLKQMRVEQLDPSTRKVTGRAYLEIEGIEE